MPLETIVIGAIVVGNAVLGFTQEAKAAVVYVPFLNAAFDTSPLAGSEWLLCAAMASSVLWANEIWKLSKRRRRPSQRGSSRATE